MKKKNFLNGCLFFPIESNYAFIHFNNVFFNCQYDKSSQTQKPTLNVHFLAKKTTKMNDSNGDDIMTFDGRNTIQCTLSVGHFSFYLEKLQKIARNY